MRIPYLKLFIHVVWGTWDRIPVEERIMTAAHVCIHEECKQMGARLVAIGGTGDHVHVVAQIPSTVSIANFMKQVKGASSHFITHAMQQRGYFKWQGSYGAFSVSESHIARVKTYILNQAEHHRERSVWDEYEKTEYLEPGSPDVSSLS